jgi:hypothetical protein
MLFYKYIICPVHISAWWNARNKGLKITAVRHFVSKVTTANEYHNNTTYD